MVQFKFTYQTATDGSSSVSSEQMKTFEMAGRIWSKHLKDDVTVNIHVGSSDQLPNNVIGGALPGIGAVTGPKDFANRLINDQTSADDATSTSNFSTGAVVNDLTIDNRTVPLTAANGKALGLVSANAESLDGVILMSDLTNLAWNQDGSTENDIGWTYPNSSSSTTYSLNFLSVALHEIGHVLGFVSVIDDEHWFATVVDPQREEELREHNVSSSYAHILSLQGLIDLRLDEGRQMPLDFFRYTTESAQQSKNNLTPKSGAYFSVDGGLTVLDKMSSAKHSGGDGYQASHWTSSKNGSRVMAPTLSLDQNNHIAVQDLRAFDVIGWDLADSLLGSDNIPSKPELNQTFNPNDVQAFTALWQEASTYIDQNQSTLTGDRVNDILQMLSDSDYYEGKRKRRRASSSWQELWQEINDVFATEARFSSFDTSTDLRFPAQPNELQHRVQVLGSQDADTLSGDEARDKLVGKQGQDVLRGYGNDDLLRGGQHRDVLVGGEGSDIFVVQDKKGFDIVRDFTDGEDFLKLSGDITFDQIGISQKNDHTLLHQEDSLLMVLRNIDAESITIANFA